MCVSTSGTIKQPRRAILLYRDRPPPSRRHCPPLPGKAPTALYPPTNALHCLHHLTTVELPAATAASFVLSGRRNMPTAATTETEQLEQQLLSGGQTHTALTVTRATGSPEGPSSRLTRTSAVTCPPAPVRAPVPTPPTAAAAAAAAAIFSGDARFTARVLGAFPFVFSGDRSSGTFTPYHHAVHVRSSAHTSVDCTKRAPT